MIRLQINDKDGNIILQDTLKVGNGDVLLCQVNGVVDHILQANIAKQLNRVLDMASKVDDKIIPLVYDHRIDFKVLKIETE